MERRIDWQRRLNDYLVKVSGRPFRYGRWDCCIYISGAVKAMTDVDPMAEFRGRYTSRETALAALRELGSGTLYNTMRTKFGNPVPAVMAKRGDIAYHEGNLGIINGRCALLLTDGGFLMVSIRAPGMKAFRVPFAGGGAARG